MEAISAQTTLVSRHPWPELRETIDEQVQKTQPQIYAIEAVVPTPPLPVRFSYLSATETFKPNKARQEVIRLFEENHPPQNPCRWRLSLLGAQTGRGSDNGCVIKRTHEARYARLIEVVHQLACLELGCLTGFGGPPGQS